MDKENLLDQLNFEKYLTFHFGKEYKKLLKDIDNKITHHVLSTCLNKVIECFDLINDGEQPTVHLVNFSYCFAAAYMTYKYAQAHGVSTSLFAGPYHVYLMKDGLIYDTFYPTGVSRKDVRLPDDFIRMEQECFGDDEVEFETFSANFYIGSTMLSLENIAGYFLNTPSAYQLAIKFIKDNDLVPDQFLLDFDLENIPECLKIGNKIEKHNFKV